MHWLFVILVVGVLGLIGGFIIMITGYKQEKIVGFIIFVISICVSCLSCVLIHSIFKKLASLPFINGVGLVVKEGKIGWGKCQIETSQITATGSDDSLSTCTAIGSDTSTVLWLDNSSSNSMSLVLAIDFFENTCDFTQFGLYQGNKLIGVTDWTMTDVMSKGSGKVNYMFSKGQLHIMRESKGNPEELFKKLRLIAETLREIEPGLFSIVLVLMCPKEGWEKWGIAFGFVGLLIWSAMQPSDLKKIQRLIDKGNLRDPSTKEDIMQFVERYGWILTVTGSRKEWDFNKEWDFDRLKED